MSRLRTTQCDFRFGSVEPLIHQEEPVGYLVRLAPQGFIIMPGWTEESPAKFICFSGDFEEIRDHPFLLQLLDRLLYAKVRLNYSRNPAHIAVFSAVPDALNSGLAGRNEANWDRYPFGCGCRFGRAPGRRVPGRRRASADGIHLEPGEPLQQLHSPGRHHAHLHGCSATAQAQVMYFWKYPATGQGSHSYSWSGQTLSADFNHEYYWSRMTNSYSSSSSAEAKDAVARLMSDVGISINMNYGTGGSGAVPNANNSLYTFFKYSSELNFEYRSYYATWADWFIMFKAQADKRWPAILATFKPGSGHAVVIDGYRTIPSNQVHVNMGWGGSADAYYDMNNIYGYGDAGSDYAMVDIHPPAVVPALYVTSPNGGETWPMGGARNITWANTGLSGCLKLVLFKDGVKLGNIALDLPGRLRLLCLDRGQLHRRRRSRGQRVQDPGDRHERRLFRLQRHHICHRRADPDLAQRRAVLESRARSSRSPGPPSESAPREAGAVSKTASSWATSRSTWPPARAPTPGPWAATSAERPGRAADTRCASSI